MTILDQIRADEFKRAEDIANTMLLYGKSPTDIKIFLQNACFSPDVCEHVCSNIRKMDRGKALANIPEDGI
tara:strand:+ start:263 stop:475 length:213 start_codon:yes stop_codon:yes gene_type:complete